MITPIVGRVYKAFGIKSYYWVYAITEKKVKVVITLLNHADEVERTLVRDMDINVFCSMDARLTDHKFGLILNEQE